MNRVFVGAVIVVCTLAFVGCRAMTGRSFGHQFDDKLITAQVKTKLTADRFGNAVSTGVGTQWGVVQLTGTVPSAEHKADAERIASRIKGVKGVQNDLVVVLPDGTIAKTERSAPAASPAAARALTLSGEVTSVDRASGDVTVKTSSGDIMLRLPASTAQGLEQGQRLSINTGGGQ